MKKILYAIEDYDYGMDDKLYDNLDEVRNELVDIYVDRVLQRNFNCSNAASVIAESIKNLAFSNPYIEDVAYIHSFEYEDGKIDCFLKFQYNK